MRPRSQSAGNKATKGTKGRATNPCGAAARWPYAPVAKPSEILATKSEHRERTINWCAAPPWQCTRLASLAVNLGALPRTPQPTSTHITPGVGERFTPRLNLSPITYLTFSPIWGFSLNLSIITSITLSSI